MPPIAIIEGHERVLYRRLMVAGVVFVLVAMVVAPLSSPLFVSSSFHVSSHHVFASDILQLTIFPISRDLEPCCNHYAHRPNSRGDPASHEAARRGRQTEPTLPAGTDQAWPTQVWPKPRRSGTCEPCEAARHAHSLADKGTKRKKTAGGWIGLGKSRSRPGINIYIFIIDHLPAADYRRQTGDRADSCQLSIRRPQISNCSTPAPTCQCTSCVAPANHSPSV